MLWSRAAKTEEARPVARPRDPSGLPCSREVALLALGSPSAASKKTKVWSMRSFLSATSSLLGPMPTYLCKLLYIVCVINKSVPSGHSLHVEPRSRAISLLVSIRAELCMRNVPVIFRIFVGLLIVSVSSPRRRATPASYKSRNSSEWCQPV